jgi:hypothetical protein
VAVHAILALIGPLLLSVDRSPAVSVEFSRRLREATGAAVDAEPAQMVAPAPADAERADMLAPCQSAEFETNLAEADAVRTVLDRECLRLELAMADDDAPV